jgi:predicted nucleic acid-binding protein
VASAGLAAGLIDTDVLIDAERGRPDAISFLTAQQGGAGVRVSVVSAMELVVGCRNAVELGYVRQFMQRVTVIPIDAAISRTAYGLVEGFFLSHGMLIPDALIAATALEHGLPLYTKNVRHFQMIPQLMVVRPYP